MTIPGETPGVFFANADPRPAQARCADCFDTHGQIAEGHFCTIHGHGFSRYDDRSEDVEWEEFWGFPEPGCTQGRWYS